MTWKEGDDVLTNDNGRGGDVDSVDDGDCRLLREFYRGDEEGTSIDRVLVVDCDVHQGDGTSTFSRKPPAIKSSIATRDCADDDRDRILRNNLHDRLFTLDLHAANNYPQPKETSNYDIPLPDECDDTTYLAALKTSLAKAFTEVQPQLVLYNAGVDVFHADKLGRLNLSWEGMERRDEHVIRTCVENGIPVACVVGGGYDDDARVVGRRHALVHRVCAKVWRERRMWSYRK